jgi:hypothetical protein
MGFAATVEASEPTSLVACKSRRLAICFICPYLSDTMSSRDRGALSAQEDGPMARLIPTSLVLATFIHPYMPKAAFTLIDLATRPASKTAAA